MRPSRELAGPGKVDAWGAAEQLLGEDRAVPCRVLGGSMAPFLSHNDVVWLRPVAPDRLRLGDVALYRDGSRHVVHRFLRRRWAGGQELLILRGDAMGRNDPPVPASQLLGRVVRLDRGGLRVNLESRRGRLLNLSMVALSCRPALLRSVRAIWRRLIPRKLWGTILP